MSDCLLDFKVPFPYGVYEQIFHSSGEYMKKFSSILQKMLFLLEDFESEKSRKPTCVGFLIR